MEPGAGSGEGIREEEALCDGNDFDGRREEAADPGAEIDALCTARLTEFHRNFALLFDVETDGGTGSGELRRDEALLLETRCLDLWGCTMGFEELRFIEVGGNLRGVDFG